MASHYAHTPSMWGIRGTALAVSLVGLLGLTAPAGSAQPATPSFDAAIEEYADYDGMKKCKPKAKPGVLAFSRIVMAAYPETTDFGITRPCKDGGDSEHKEGRAWDWGVDASDPAHRRAAGDLLEWLLATDRHGNEHAMFRRLGLMYVIWNRKMFGSWDQEWEIYCVKKKRRCKDPDSKSWLHPHTDHVHFSFSWKGARMQTSFWTGSAVPPVQPPPVPVPVPTPLPTPSPPPLPEV
ncbi:MAG TPA: hypothetical protein VG602_03855 [Actinomycetota bacterium]|nr:hypothetical protein [Actinomycetota bacterium]